VSATCVRVPVITTHAMRCTHVRLGGSVDKPARCSPRSDHRAVRRPAAGQCDARRLWVATRPGSAESASAGLPNTLELFICGDNLRKGCRLTPMNSEVVAAR